MKKILIVLAILCLTQCKKDKPKHGLDVIESLSISNHNLLADGYTSDTATAVINNNTFASKRYIIFKITGSLASADSTKTIVAPASYINGQLIARTIFKAPLKPGMLYVSASPIVDSFDARNFTLNDSFYVNASVPTSIKLSPSAFGIKTNYGNEIVITGVLRNMFNKPASLSDSVKFVDTLENGIAAKGNFRQITNPSDSISEVSVGYSIYSGNIGDRIIIKAFVLDSFGVRRPFYDSTILTITQ
jgi:hypothetical protein